jgi:predicted metal-dependent phosphoesterase TrpH
MILKSNLHFHTKNDVLDRKIAPYDIYEGIDYAKEKGFDVLAFTPHRKFLFRNEYVEYAARKGILLIPGAEIEIKGKHIVVLNCDKKIEEIKNFIDLKNYKIKRPRIFIIAPHPFVFSPKSLFSNLIKNINLFDAIEMSVFSNKLFNFNKKAKEVAEKYNLPFIAASDTHFLKDLERGYALIDAKDKTVESVFAAMREKRFQNKMDSMSPLAMAEIKIKSGFRLIGWLSRQL